jgi:hypothetical protein
MKFFFSLITIIAMFGVSSNVSAQTEYKTVDGYAACISKKYIDDFVTYATQKDLDAMQQLLDAGLCISMAAGISVYVMDTTLGLVEFRLKGDTQTFWTVREGVKR